MRSFTVHDAEPRDITIQGGLAGAGLRPNRRVNVRETYCLTCDKSGANVSRVVGRWDPERQATALPFEPVAAFLTCGCVVGNPTLAGPNPSEHVPGCNEKCDERSHYLTSVTAPGDGAQS